MNKNGFITSSIILLITIFIILVGVLFFYKEKIKVLTKNSASIIRLNPDNTENPKIVTTPTNKIGTTLSPWAPSNKTLKYNNEFNSLVFMYPDNLFLVDKNAQNIQSLPRLYFNNNNNEVSYPNFDCGSDCIVFNAYLKVIDASSEPYYDLEFDVQQGTTFPIYAYPHYVYPGETNIKIGNLNVTSFYFAGWQTNGSKYVLGEDIFIHDPYVSNRVITVRYEEVRDTKFLDFAHTSAKEIKENFHPQKYSAFENILNSLSLKDIQVLGIKKYLLNDMGLSFEAPSYWGTLEGKISNGLIGPNWRLQMQSNAFTYSGPTNIGFYAQNSVSAEAVYESFQGYLSKYSGQSLDSFCRNKGYLNVSGPFEVKIDKCLVKENKNNLRIGEISGRYAQTSSYGSGDIPVSERIYKNFRIISLITKSKEYPGLSIILEWVDKSTGAEIDTFNMILNSLKY